MSKRPRIVFLPIVLASLIVVIDQVVKMLVLRQIGPGQDRYSIWIAGDWLGLSYAENTGVAFGLLRDRSTIWLVAGSVIVLALIGFYVRAHRHSLTVLIAGGLIAGGAIGNMIDRIRLGYVRDFFAVGSWPSFNVADSAITIGVLLALFGSMRDEKRGAGDRTETPGVNPNHRRALLDTTE